jgi:hypothetical protein
MTKRLILAAVLLAIVVQPLHADFAAVAKALDNQRGVSRIWIPFLGVARTLVRVVRPKGVHDIQLVTFNTDSHVDPLELQRIMRTQAGPGFQPLVQVYSKRSGEWSFIYARPSTDSSNRIELMVLAHDDDNTVLVRVDVDASEVARDLGDHPRGVIRMARR